MKTIATGDLRKIVAQTFDCSTDVLTSECQIDSLENCDSVAMLSLMVNLDDEFGIKLDHLELTRLKMYGDIEKIVQEKGILLK
jgi:acyl carrier protein